MPKGRPLKAVKPVKKVVEPVVEEVVDPRAAYNCEPCKGEGILPNGVLCTNCNATGKV